MKLLIIEDSASLRRSLRIGLANLGFAVDDTGDGAQGLSMAMTGEYELIILDIMFTEYRWYYFIANHKNQTA